MKKIKLLSHSVSNNRLSHSSIVDVPRACTDRIDLKRTPLARKKDVEYFVHHKNGNSCTSTKSAKQSASVAWPLG